jgi:hypothetical protein
MRQGETEEGEKEVDEEDSDVNSEKSKDLTVMYQ